MQRENYIGMLVAVFILGLPLLLGFTASAQPQADDSTARAAMQTGQWRAFYSPYAAEQTEYSTLPPGQPYSVSRLCAADGQLWARIVIPHGHDGSGWWWVPGSSAGLDPTGTVVEPACR